MPIEYINGNIFHSDKPVIAHSVNCKGVFGAGFALEIAKHYPEAKEAYLDKFQHKGWKPGNVQIVHLARKIVVNMALQDTYGRSGVHTKLSACETAFNIVFKYCQNHNYNISMPKVGSGLGGEKWANVESILIECLKPFPSVVVDVYYL
jgi:O-acetyl-ADP-ribose deacetylase (regulator of RNase III)